MNGTELDTLLETLDQAEHAPIPVSRKGATSTRLHEDRLHALRMQMVALAPDVLRRQRKALQDIRERLITTTRLAKGMRDELIRLCDEALGGAG